MTRKSISLRIYRAILTVSVISMIAMVVTVILVSEDLERTMLEVEFAQESNFILMNHTGDDVLQWESPDLAVVFVPNDKPRPAVLPRVFHDLPDSYSKETKLDGETYLITIRTVDTGLLYVAKNITHFENRETLFQLALVFIALIIIAVSFLLALLSSRRIVRPLALLSERISRIPVGTNMPRMGTDYADAELNSIATTFNRFLDELESYVRREQSLLNLASHELRMPIAVMSGALDILEVRDQLNPNDRATLKRVRRSCDEMRDNVDILLKLARREQGSQIHEVFDVGSTAQQVIDDLKISLHAAERVTLNVTDTLKVNSDPTMVRMLLRNLIQNAIQHTKRNIRVTISAGIVEIEDQGTGLSTTQQAILRGEKSHAADGLTLSGLGLYIVTLMAERLDWGLDIAQTDTIGTRIRLTPEGAVNS